MQVHLESTIELITAFHVILVARNMKGTTIIIWETLKFGAL